MFTSIFAWFSRRLSLSSPNVPMTLVSLTLKDHVQDEELSFHEDAEGEALADWVRSHTILSALVTDDQTELHMLVAGEPAQVTGPLHRLPSVVGEMVDIDLRKVHLLPVERMASFSQH